MFVHFEPTKKIPCLSVTVMYRSFQSLKIDFRQDHAASRLWTFLRQTCRESPVTCGFHVQLEISEKQTTSEGFLGETRISRVHAIWDCFCWFCHSTNGSIGGLGPSNRVPPSNKTLSFSGIQSESKATGHKPWKESFDLAFDVP